MNGKQAYDVAIAMTLALAVRDAAVERELRRLTLTIEAGTAGVHDYLAFTALWQEIALRRSLAPEDLNLALTPTVTSPSSLTGPCEEQASMSTCDGLFCRASGNRSDDVESYSLALV